MHSNSFLHSPSTVFCCYIFPPALPPLLPTPIPIPIPQHPPSTLLTTHFLRGRQRFLHGRKKKLQPTLLLVSFFPPSFRGVGMGDVGERVRLILLRHPTLDARILGRLILWVCVWERGGRGHFHCGSQMSGFRLMRFPEGESDDQFCELVSEGGLL